MNTCYPWQARQWADLCRIAENGRLGHALLFSGREGLGVEHLAGAFAHWMLCEAPSPDTRPCGDCRGCSLFAAGTHPDFKTLVPAEEGKAILIDQVRELTEFYTLKAHYEGAKIVFICPADAMNRAAANAMLKVLEEPPAGALLLLVAHRFSAVPMTIRSRCVRIACDQIDPDAALRWLSGELPQFDPGAVRGLLSQAAGAPLTAQNLATDDDRSGLEAELLHAFQAIQQDTTQGLVQAKQFANLPPKDLIQLLTSMTARLILAKFGCRSFYEDPDGQPDLRLQGLADHLNLKHLYAFLDLLFELKAVLARQSGMRDIDIVDSLWLGLADAAGNGAGKER